MAGHKRLHSQGPRTRPTSCTSISSAAMEGLDAIAQMADAKAKGEAYNATLAALVSSGDVQGCRQFVDHGARSLDKPLVACPRLTPPLPVPLQ